MDHPLDAQIPRGPLSVPERVRQLAGADTLEPVWRNGLGGVTFRMGAGTPRDRYAKWHAVDTPELDHAAEAARLTWAGGFVAVPSVLAVGSDAAGSWLVTAALPGHSAVAPSALANPARSARAIGAGLRALHDTLPVAGCPFSWAVPGRLDAVQARLDAGQGPETWAPEHAGLTAGDALAILSSPPPAERLVVCHGDPCAPNTLLDEAGAVVGHVDLGGLGVADPVADLAVAAWSTEWNYGGGYVEEVYAGYGSSPDPAAVAYYRLLWDLS